MKVSSSSSVLLLAVAAFAVGILTVMTSSSSSSQVEAFNVQHATQTPKGLPTNRAAATSATFLEMVNPDEQPDPTTFREAEILGLRLMQEGNFAEALVAFEKGMKLPGSRPDVLRTKSLSGPSPVGGAFGGTESNRVMTLDEFELQAAHYNMACANARIGNIDASIMNLSKAFENGFDNYSTVRGDPDLDPIKNDPDFAELMERFEGKGGFNPFGFFGKK
eukprot:CAMPEP_0113452352 /NCGR_PEP_ID=MMETSP0014_2-20120614/6802_1 /TAXON_ID=2857 /ORGANISM="Nitzschia sp." /LENGTH=219 /DNA_ID=CAMNT_0000343721 /DNA_START=155 /DNA_END=814 /DNA_ORIENTATION=- /assembly_acc=CAM_ASM_000159